MKKFIKSIKNFVIKIETRIDKRPKNQRIFIGIGLIIYSLIAYIIPLLPATIPLIMGIRILYKIFKKNKK